MSNSVSTAINTATAKGTKMPIVPNVNQRQQQFEYGTNNLLDSARTMAENAAGQGQELDPMIYSYLGLQPQYEDHTADMQTQQQELDAAQQQYSEALTTVSQLKAIPKGQRTPEQRQQLRQLNKNMPNLVAGLGKTRNAFDQLQSMPKTITGLSRMDPSQIPADSPFSPNNPLNKAASEEGARLDALTQYGAQAGGVPAPGQAAGTVNGTAIDPTLVHHYDQQEAQLRAQLAAKYGPDYENSSIGQMAIQMLNRERTNAYATWANTMQQTLQQEYLQAQQGMFGIAQQQIGLWREPSTTQQNVAGQLSNLAGQRLTQQQTFNQRLGMHVGLQENAQSAAPVGMNLLGAAGSSGLGGAASNAVTSAGSGLYNYFTSGGWRGAGGGAAPLAGGYESGLANTATAGVGGGMSSADVGAGMSAVGGGEIVGAGGAADLAVL